MSDISLAHCAGMLELVPMGLGSGSFADQPEVYGGIYIPGSKLAPCVKSCKAYARQSI